MVTPAVLHSSPAAGIYLSCVAVALSQRVGASLELVVMVMVIPGIICRISSAVCPLRSSIALSPLLQTPDFNPVYPSGPGLHDRLLADRFPVDYHSHSLGSHVCLDSPAGREATVASRSAIALFQAVRQIDSCLCVLQTVLNSRRVFNNHLGIIPE